MCDVTYISQANDIVDSMYNGQRKQMFNQMEACTEKAAALDYIKTTMGVQVAYDVAVAYFYQKEKQHA